MEYISGKEAMMLLGISTRQRLNQLVREKGIEFKSTGVGLPNVYLKSDIEKHIKPVKPPKPPRVIIPRKKRKKIPETPPPPKRKKKTMIEVKKEIEIVQKNIEHLKNKDEIKKEIGFLNQDPLNEIGKEHFNYLREQLIKDGTYQEKDVGLLQSYCISYQNYIHHSNQSNSEFGTTIDNLGNVKISPHFIVADKCLIQMAKIGSILGIGARSRVGLPIKEPKKESVFDILNVKEEF